MKANQRFQQGLALAILLTAIGWSRGVQAANVSSIQSGDWETTTTWDCGCVPGAGDTITIANGNTVKVNATHHTGSVTVNGTLDTNDQFFEFEGSTFANNGSVISSAGSFGEIDFNGVGAVAGTTQTISGAGAYAGVASFPVEIYLANNTTVTPASGTVIGGVRTFFVPTGSTFSLTHTLVFSDGSILASNGTISGLGTLQTQGLVTLTLAGSTTAPLEVVSGTTTALGNFGAITVDNGATLFLNGTFTPHGNLIVASGGILDTNDQFLEFQGTTLTNNGSIISSTGGFGEIDFVGAGGVAGTAQTIGGTGPYAGGASAPVAIVLGNSVTVTAASGAVIDGVFNFNIQNGCTLSVPNTLIFKDGGLTSNIGGAITGAGTIKTQGAAALNFSGGTAPKFEVVSGTTAALGNFGQITIDNGATLLLTGTSYFNGNVTVASGAIFDANNKFVEIQGTTLTNNGSVISSSGGYGQFDFNGVNAVASTTQNVAGNGSYDTNGRNDFHFANNVTIAVASGAALNGVAFITIDAGTTFNFTGSGSLTLAGGITNSGTFKLDGGSTGCGDVTKILIRSSVTGVQRGWSGAGTYSLTDVDVKDQAGSAAITVTGGVNSGNNGANWSFMACPTPTPPPSRLLNISTRLNVLTTDKVLIGGFIVTGTQPKKVILRAIGPSLANANPPVANALVDPILELHEPDGTVITNDNWQDTQKDEIIASTVPPTNDFESAIVATLAPGPYTAVVSGKNSGIGVGLVEAYDLDQAADSELANISTRGFVETGDNVMIGGFIVGGGGSTSVIVRAIGPSLADANPPVQGALPDPVLELHDSNGATLASNDNWRDTQEAEIIATTVPPTNNLESAIVMTLAPGAYTAVVSGKNNTTGVALVEAYNLH